MKQKLWKFNKLIFKKKRKLVVELITFVVVKTNTQLDGIVVFQPVKHR